MPIPRRTSVKVEGRVLYLTEDPAPLKQQLGGEDLGDAPAPEALVSNISTDEITPGWVCYYYDETLARYCLVGLRGGHVERDAIKSGGFGVIVSGRSKGCGSSRARQRLTSSEKAGGVQLVDRREHREDLRAELPEHRPAHLHRLLPHPPHPGRRGDPHRASSPSGLDPISRGRSSESGGLFEYNKRPYGRRDRPRAARHHREGPADDDGREDHRRATPWSMTPRRGRSASPAVASRSDALFVRTDIRFSHEYVTPMADSLFVAAGFGPDAVVRHRARAASSPSAIT